MQRNFILIIYTLLIQAAAYASSASTEGHTPSAGDLKWKFISFFIVFFFVGKFAKKLMKENFSKMHEIIKAKFDEALIATIRWYVDNRGWWGRLKN